jgi:UDP-3-O-acyl N-acetylglucosamine deacetylase
LRDAVFNTHNERRTTAGVGPEAVQTVEHFLAALWAAEIDNIIVELSAGEMPALDGSAAGFLELFEAAGTREQHIDRISIDIDRELKVEESGRSIKISPYNGFKITYSIDYPHSIIGRQSRDFEVNAETFKKEIASARTFCLKKEAEALLKAGLGQGADYQNTLVFDNGGPIGTALRYEDEPLRHKVLDLIGDLYMLGIRIHGKVEAEKSGHKMNAQLLKLIYNTYCDK